MDGLIVLGMLVFLLVGMLGFLASAVGGLGGLLVAWRVLGACFRGLWLMVRGVRAVFRYFLGDRPRRLHTRALRGSGREIRWGDGHRPEAP